MIGKTLPGRPGRARATRAPWPSWKTSTRAPKAAPTESRLSRTALIATSSERNPAKSARNVQPTTSRIDAAEVPRDGVLVVGVEAGLAADAHALAPGSPVTSAAFHVRSSRARADLVARRQTARPE